MTFVSPDLYVRVPRSGGPRDRDHAVLERPDKATPEKRVHSGLHQDSHSRGNILQYEVKQNTVKLGYNELSCLRTLGYNEQILRANWSFYCTN